MGISLIKTTNTDILSSKNKKTSENYDSQFLKHESGKLCGTNPLDDQKSTEKFLKQCKAYFNIFKTLCTFGIRINEYVKSLKGFSCKVVQLIKNENPKILKLACDEKCEEKENLILKIWEDDYITAINSVYQIFEKKCKQARDPSLDVEIIFFFIENTCELLFNSKNVDFNEVFYKLNKKYAGDIKNEIKIYKLFRLANHYHMHSLQESMNYSDPFSTLCTIFKFFYIICRIFEIKSNPQNFKFESWFLRENCAFFTKDTNKNIEEQLLDGITNVYTEYEKGTKSAMYPSQIIENLACFLLKFCIISEKIDAYVLGLDVCD